MAFSLNDDALFVCPMYVSIQQQQPQHKTEEAELFAGISCARKKIVSRESRWSSKRIYSFKWMAVTILSSEQMYL